MVVGDLRGYGNIVATIVVAAGFDHSTFFTGTFIGIGKRKADVFSHAIVQVESRTCTKGEVEEQ